MTLETGQTNESIRKTSGRLLPAGYQITESRGLVILDENKAANPSESRTTPFKSEARFSSAATSYRIFRLSIELFLVEYMLEAGNTAKLAGFVFLTYSVADVLAGLFILWYPLLWFGSWLRGTIFFIFSVSSMVGGFIGLFFSRSLGMTMVSASICGIGTATWFVNYQTLTNKGFPDASMSKIAQKRQVFECVGFLIPSICLAIVNSQDHSDFSHIVMVSVIILSIIGFVIFSVSSYPVISCAANIQTEALVQQTESSWKAVKTLFTSDVITYFWLDTILLALANILFATLSTITEHYFGLEPSFLWLAAIGTPIGGAISAFCSLKMWFTHGDDRRAVLNGSLSMTIIFILLILLSPLATNALSSNSGGSQRGNKSLLFLFGLVIGFLYSKTFTSAFALWLRKLNQERPDFISRANILHNVGVQLIIAAVFQIQMTLIDVVRQNSIHPMLESLIFFGPHTLLCVGAYTLTCHIPFPSDPKFGWPIPTPFTFTIQMVLKFFGYLSPGSLDGLAFGMFCDYRTSHFARYLANDTVIQIGPGVDPTSSLTSEHIKKHLKTFDGLGTEEQWWESTATINNILMSNHASFSKRLELIEMAKSSICIIVWSLDGITGRLVADKLIQRSQEGVNVRVVVDAVNLYYHSELLRVKKSTDGNSCLDHISRLIRGGANVQMLDSWYNMDSGKPYVIGTHRKLMVVDNKWLLTGGRNIEDSYARHEAEDEHYKFHDADVVLEGDFSSSTSLLFEDLWTKSRNVEAVLPNAPSAKPIDTDRRNSIAETESTDRRNSIAEIESIFSNDEIQNDEGDPRARFFLRARRSSSMNIVTEDMLATVSLFQIDHKAGLINGNDLILSTLVFLLETATTSIDLMFGYFQLFPVLEEALKRAVARGVKVRLFTNSPETNDLYYCNGLFREAFCSLLEMGVEVYVPTEPKKFCVHYKGVLVDSRAWFLGSWNALGFSTFYEAEFSVLMVADEEENALFAQVETFCNDLISDGLYIRMADPPKEYEFPAHIAIFCTIFCTKYVHRQVKKGF